MSWPRRCCLELNTPAELKIRDATRAVEELGAHPKLTDVVVLLGQAHDALADWVDAQEVDKPRAPAPPVEQWNVGEPMGPNGPFWSVVSSAGRVIALQVPSRELAERIAKLPGLEIRGKESWVK